VVASLRRAPRQLQIWLASLESSLTEFEPGFSNRADAELLDSIVEGHAL